MWHSPLATGLCSTPFGTTIISPGVVESELAATITDPDTAAYIDQARQVALKADVIAQAIRYAIEQPADVAVNEIIVRPMGGAF